MQLRKKILALVLAIVTVIGVCIPTLAAASDTGFSDVDANAWYAEAVTYCKAQGWMNGTSATEFSPDATLTRAMVATVLYRAEKEPAVSGTLTFTDTQSGQWYSNAVLWVNAQGIVQGYGNGSFGTNDPITREQLDIIIRRYKGETPTWTGDPALNVPASRAEAAVAFYGALKEDEEETSAQEGRLLIAYFSATNNTEGVANHIKAILGDSADLYEIVPETPYTSADLNYNTDCRANREQNDDAARPAISGSVENMEQYDVIFLGYPIWWGKAPKIIHTFLESYELNGKIIIPFCTSGGSGYNDSTIQPLAPDAVWQTGRRFSGGASRETAQAWIDTLELPKQEETTVKQITLSFNGHTYPATLEDSATAAAFAQLLQSKGGSMTIPMSEYGGWEKVGSLGQDLPSNNVQTTTAPGDFVLYSGNQIVLFYGSNSWSYTRLGHLDDPSGLQDALGSGDLDVTFALAQ